MTADAPDKNENKIQLTRIAHVYYRYASQDIQAAHEFMQDFGFFHVKSVGPRTYYRGYGPEPFVLCVEEAAAEDHTNSSNTDNDSRPKTGTQFGGAAFAVASLDELEKATRVLPPEARATSVYELKDAPGGGKCVSFWDPVDGFPFHLVWGQTLAEPIDLALPEPKTNFPGHQTRPTNTPQRFTKRPAPVHKLGHFGFCVTSFAESYAFYSSHFNFYPSELIHDATGRDITVFFRLDKGEEKVDHHCFFFFEGADADGDGDARAYAWPPPPPPPSKNDSATKEDDNIKIIPPPRKRGPHVHHSSFETHDFNAQVLGHDWLRQRGYRNCWGVGRHIMGSQIFDYWYDPKADFILEHYVDGDLLDRSYPTQYTKAAPDNLHVWGPEVPPTFLT